MLSSILASAALAVAAASAQSDIPISQPLQNILKNTNSPLYTYPTSLTQGIIPKALHSHNDYWRQLPFYSALSVGAVSIEADVWLYNGTLHVSRRCFFFFFRKSDSSEHCRPLPHEPVSMC